MQNFVIGALAACLALGAWRLASTEARAAVGETRARESERVLKDYDVACMNLTESVQGLADLLEKDRPPLKNPSGQPPPGGWPLPQAEKAILDGQLDVIKKLDQLIVIRKQSKILSASAGAP